MLCSFAKAQKSKVLDYVFAQPIHQWPCQERLSIYLVSALYLNGPPRIVAAMASSVQVTKLICFDAARKSSLVFFSSNRRVQFQHAQLQGLPKKMLNERMLQSRQYQLAPLAMGTSEISIDSSYPSHIIKQFYSNINQKNFNKLDRLLSDDCLFEDYSFPKPFQGKQEVLNFLKQLTTSMGQNVEFNVERFFEGDGYKVTVNWHLDWKKKQIPFTRGCSYYELSRDGERLVIKKVQVVIESPIKPGGLALAFFKIITSIFDAFPDAAERFLESPHIIFQLLLKLYHVILKPVLNPIIAWYVKLWSFMFSILSFTLKILYYIAKLFNK